MAKNKAGIISKLGPDNFDKFLKACEENRISRDAVLNIAREISTSVAGSVEIEMQDKYRGRETGKMLLDVWFESKEGDSMTCLLYTSDAADE